MRITNSMMTNSTLININRNMRYLDKLTRQIESTKKIQSPSDDPIVASRSLKFRTNVSETEQFQRNVDNGLAWINVSEASFTNVVDKLLMQFRERCVEGATGTEQVTPDKWAVVTELRELIDQIGVEMNQTYAGRYVFSGYRTDQPPVLIEDNQKTYEITQHFTMADIEKTKSYQKLITAENGAAVTPDSAAEPLVKDINIIKMAYKDVDTASLTVAGFNVVTYSSLDSAAYDPDWLEANATALGGKVAHYIHDTGELVFSDADASSFPEAGVDVSYVKTDFKKGELNPVVYFNCTEYDENGAPLNSYNMDDQGIEYEFATRTYVQINSLSKDTYTDKMFADLRAICDFAMTLKVSDEKVLQEKYKAEGLTDDDLTNAVKEQLASENSKMQSALYSRFNNMLYLVDRHAANVSKEHTTLGSRGHRLELMQERLEQDADSYTQLLADNEDTDLPKAMLLKSSAYAAFTASLQASADILQLSLANFLN